TPTVFPSQNCGRTISAACLVALCCCLVFTMAVIIPSSFSPTKVCDYASRRLSLPTCLRFPRGTDAPTSLQPYLNSFPLPNRPDTRYGFAPFVASFADSASLDAASLRIDHSIGNRLTLFGRYNYAPSDTTARLFAINNPTETIANTTTLTLGATWLASPRLSNEVRLNSSHTTGESYSRLDTFGG